MPILSFFPGGGSNAKARGVVASITPDSAATYVSEFSTFDAETVSLYAAAISNNAAINSETAEVYIDHGNLHYKLSVGDQIVLKLNGAGYAFDIIGFNHDALTDATTYGEATATGKAGITLQMHDIFADISPMVSKESTNAGGWKSSTMRSVTMDTMKSYLSDEWRLTIKPVNKIAGTGGGASSGTETVSDSCFLLAEVEIFGKTTYSVSGEGAQYAYYKAGNSAVKKKSGSVYNWWERSPRSNNSEQFCMVHSGGTAHTTLADSSYGVAFAFCV